jgi:hypothetical protein
VDTVGLESLRILVLPALNFHVIFSEVITVDLVSLQEFVFKKWFITSYAHIPSDFLDQFQNHRLQVESNDV